MEQGGKDFREHRELWHEVFDDTEMYMNYYFSRKAPRSQVWEDRDEGQLCSMAFFTAYDVRFREKEYRIPYIVGVATREDRRHEGRMTRVLTQGMDGVQKQGCPLVFLSPIDTSIYEPLGFVPVYWRESIVVEGGGEEKRKVFCWDELSLEKRQRVADFAEKQIQRKMPDLYMVHHTAYYDEVHRELRALKGALLVFFRGEEVVGVADWICEEGKHEVTELICQEDEAESVVESLQAWVKGEQVIIEDAMFLAKFKGGRRIAQEKPYLMCRSLLGEDLRGLRCYINDIT